MKHLIQKIVVILSSWIQLLTSYNNDVNNIVLENTPKSIQKEFLHIVADKVRRNFTNSY